MKRVLVVDDEPPIINGLSLLFKRYFQAAYTVIGVAQTGREAIEKCAQLGPDIVLMDVQMPGITGLDAIREISQTGAPRAFILVTAYERFDIAREALSMGVCDYLLKPVSKDRLEIALQAASTYLDRTQLLNARELEFKDRQQRLIPLIEEAFFLEIRRDALNHAQSPQGARGEFARRIPLFKEQLSIAEDSGIVGFVSLSPAGGDAKSLHERFVSTIRYKTRALVGPLEDGRLCALFLPLRGDKGAENDRSGTRTERDSLHEVLKAGFATELATGELKISFGEPAPLLDLGRSWSGALRNFTRSPLSQDFTSAEAKGAADASESLLEDPWSRQNAACARDGQFYEQIAEGQYALAGQSFEKMLLPLEGERAALSPNLFFSICGALSFAVLKLAGGGALSGEAYREFMDYSDLQALWSAGLRQRFAASARERFLSLQRGAAEAGLHSPFVVKALQYIESHYQEQITLESAAEAVGISPGHLTRLMSDELKRGFAHTLIDFRMRKAKELLRQPALSIKEVSMRCGYPDANYFSRLFRRMIGWTPREYAARQSRGEDANAQ